MRSSEKKRAASSDAVCAVSNVGPDLVKDYEELRAVFLAERSEAVTDMGMRRIMTEGIFSWAQIVQKQRRADPLQGPLVIPRDLSEDQSEDAMIQLMASMTMHSLRVTEETFENPRRYQNSISSF